MFGTEGALIRNYYGVVHLSHGNYVAMVSGQGANLQEQTDCQFFTDFEYGRLNRHAHYDPSAAPLFGRDGQALGGGCVFPTSFDGSVRARLRCGGIRTERDSVRLVFEHDDENVLDRRGRRASGARWPREREHGEQHQGTSHNRLQRSRTCGNRTQSAPGVPMHRSPSYARFQLPERQ
jgi:hypothetical protein